MAVLKVRVPKTPPGAYNADRQVSDLLMSQIEHLQQAVRESITTEGQAADYIGELTRRVQAAHAHVEPQRYFLGRKRSSKRSGRSSPKRGSAAKRRGNRR